MALLAAYQVLLFRYSGQEEVIVGCPIAGRTEVSTEPLVGCFINTLALRGRPRPEMSFRDFLGQIRDKALAAYQHQGLPFEKVVEAVNPPRTTNTPPVFQTLLNFRNLPSPPAVPGGLQIEPWDFDYGLAQFDLALTVAEHPASGISCDWTYDRDLFAEDDIRRLAECYGVLLGGALADPAAGLGELPLLSPEQRQRILVEFNDTRRDYPRDKCVHELIEERAAADSRRRSGDLRRPATDVSRDSTSGQTNSALSPRLGGRSRSAGGDLHRTLSGNGDRAVGHPQGGRRLPAGSKSSSATTGN